MTKLELEQLLTFMRSNYPDTFEITEDVTKAWYIAMHDQRFENARDAVLAFTRTDSKFHPRAGQIISLIETNRIYQQRKLQSAKTRDTLRAEARGVEKSKERREQIAKEQMSRLNAQLDLIPEENERGKLAPAPQTTYKAIGAPYTCHVCELVYFDKQTPCHDCTNRKGQIRPVCDKCLERITEDKTARRQLGLYLPNGKTRQERFDEKLNAGFIAKTRDHTEPHPLKPEPAPVTTKEFQGCDDQRVVHPDDYSNPKDRINKILKSEAIS